jgi:hypothetical protein
MATAGRAETGGSLRAPDQAVLTIEAIDAEAGTATLRGPAGNARVVPVTTGAT